MISKTILAIGLASNFSSLSQNNLNPYSNTFEKGVNLALDLRQDELKAREIQIEFQKFDTGGGLRASLQSARAAAASKVVAVVGYHASSDALLAAPLYKNKVLVVSPSASANRVFNTGSNIFSLVFSNAAQATAIVQVAREKFHPKKVHVVAMTDCAYCMDLADSIVEESKKANIEVVRNEVLESAKDYKDVVPQIVSDGTTVTFVPAYEHAATKFIQQALDAGYTGGFVGGDGWYNSNGARILRLRSEKPFKGYFIGHWTPEVDNPTARKFIAEFKKKFSQAPDADAALGFDAFQFVLDAILKAKTLDRDGIAKGAQDIESLNGVAGPMEFIKTAQGTQITKNAPVFSIDLKNKRFHFEETKKLVSIKRADGNSKH